MQEIGILWDMDGTIIDSIQLHYKTWHMALKKFGSDLSFKQFKQAFGRNSKISLPIYLGHTPDEALASEIIDLKEKYFQEYAAIYAKPFPGVLNWLSYFRKMQLKQALASSAPPENILAVIEAFDLEKYFDVVIPGSDLPSKPAPDIFLKTAEVLNLVPHRCLVIEDSVSGLKAGKKAGMTTIGIATTENLIAEDADIIIHDYLLSPQKVLMDLYSLIKDEKLTY